MNLDDRMKLYERQETGRTLLPTLPVIARVDGRAFHSFTQTMERPFDKGFSSSMAETMLRLVQETNACFGYTQSDEITLVWHSPTVDDAIWFNGRIFKMTSQLGSLATLYFDRAIRKHLPGYENLMPTFDARVWNVPSRQEAANAILWRVRDAVRNSIHMAASHYYTQKELHRKNQAQMHEMLHAAGVNWNAYPVEFKQGVFARRQIVETPFTTDELQNLPLKHEARKNPSLVVRRQKVLLVNLSDFARLTNKESVIFDGDFPRVSAFIDDEMVPESSK